MLENKLVDIFTDYVEMIKKPAHISGSFIDHVCVIKNLMEEFFINATVNGISFSVHDAVRTIIERNAVDFHTIP